MNDKRNFSRALAKHFPAAPGLRGADLIHSCGRASHALLYSVLYLPELVELEGSVLLGWNLPSEQARSEFVSRLQSIGTKLEREKLEASFNLVEVGYLFDGERRDTSDAEDEILAEVIKNAWRGCLAIRFPRRRFVVEVLPPQQTGSTVGVHFYEKTTAAELPATSA